jgi:hypothetical protein
MWYVTIYHYRSPIDLQFSAIVFIALDCEKTEVWSRPVIRGKATSARLYVLARYILAERLMTDSSHKLLVPRNPQSKVLSDL